MNRTTIAAALAAAALAAPASALAAERVSVSSAGAQGDAQSGYGIPHPVAVSGDGRFVAFESDAANLVAGDDNGIGDVFVRDRLEGATSRVTGDIGGTQPAISSDGRVVAYVAVDGRLPRGFARSTGLDVFVTDRAAGRTVRVSRRFAAAPRDRRVLSQDVAISADGRYVAYTAERLLRHDDVAPLGLFVFDRRTGRTARIGRAGLDAATPSLSRDGARIAFFAASGQRTRPGVYAADRRTGRLTRVLATRHPAEPAVSADGRHLVYEQPRAGRYRLSVRDLRTGRVRAAGRGVGASISRHGGRIAFQTTSDGLIGDSAGPIGEVVVRDVRTGAERTVSDGSRRGGFPALSADGRLVAFASGAAITSDDTNSASDVFTEDAR